MKTETCQVPMYTEVCDLKSWLKRKRRRRTFEPENTPEQEQAFDLGYKQGAEFGENIPNPYQDHADHSLWQAWEAGHSVGVLDFDSGKAEKS